MSLNKIPSVSVIIATKNEERNIERCLRSIKNQSQKAEIIVVDNFSVDKTLQIAKVFTTHTYQKGKERSSQRNFGLKKAHGSYVLFLDADMEIGPNLLKECLQKMHKNPKASGIIIDEIVKGHNFLSRIKSVEKNLTNKNTLIEAARFFKKRAVQKAGGYDENLISGEDWDISIRTNKLGPFSRVRSKIIHHEDKTFWEDIKKKYYYAKNIERYAKKHPEEFKKQSGLFRFSNLFKKPAVIYYDPAAFLSLMLLKSVQYSAYILSKFTAQIRHEQNTR